MTHSEQKAYLRGIAIKSVKKIFMIFALFAMVACLSISSFALEPDAAMEEIPSEPDTVMSEADII